MIGIEEAVYEYQAQATMLKVWSRDDYGHGHGPLPHAYRPRRVTYVDAPRQQAARRDASQCQDTSFTDRDARSDDCPRCDPSAVANTNRCDTQIKPNRCPIVIASAEIGSLRYAAVCADRDIGRIIDPHVFPYPGVVADHQPPGKFHSDAGLDFDAASYARAEHAQDQETMRRAWNL
jgi:hypothetical protein